VNEDTLADPVRPTVFLSYARSDQEMAAQLVMALEAAGLSLWWDARIEGGAAFAKSIEAALEECDAVIVVWSAKSIGSDWVLDEAAKGRDLHKLVPVSFDGTAPPLGFRQYQSLSLSHWKGSPDAAEIANVVRGVQAAARKSQHAAPSVAAARNRPFVSRRGVIIAAAGATLAGAAGLFAWRQGVFGRRLASGNSVAVLPFKNLSGDEAQAYFSDGLSEELRATLARNLKLQVMAQASSAIFRDRKEDAVTIASTLGVAYLLDGSVQRSGDIVRITTDLIDGATGFSRWSQKFDRVMQDIFVIQDEISSRVAQALVAEVDASEDAASGNKHPAAPSGGTTSVAAYDAYLRGRALYDLSADETSERAALAQFDAAIAADPDYAAAHAARARSLTAIANQYGEVGQLAEYYEAAITSARRAIAIAPDLADAHSTLGFTLFQGQLDARAARDPFERSRELGAGEATVMARYAQYSARIGRERAAAEAIKRALTLDPLNPLIYRAAGSIEYAAHRYAESIPPARKALSLNPKLSRANAAIGDALLMLGRAEEARTAYAAEPVEHKLGHAAVARAAKQELVENLGDRVLYQQAQILAQWGERDDALTRLEQARRIGDSGLIYLRNDPLLDRLRDNPRFAKLLGSIGFD
jgi:TolB-like protein/Flp pilus assembly protein TadD